MTLAAIDWLSISINLLLVVFVIVCLLMILLVLMQRPKQEGLGAAFGAGVTDQVFGARTTTVLQRGTVYLASLFFLLSLVLAVLIGHKNQKTSMLSPKTPATKVGTPLPDQPKVEPVKPKSLSEELPLETTPAETPAAPPVTLPAAPPVTLPAAPPATLPAAPPVTLPAAPPAAAPATEAAAPAGSSDGSQEKSVEP